MWSGWRAGVGVEQLERLAWSCWSGAVRAEQLAWSG